MNLSNALQHLFPGSNPLTDYRVQDDGNGPYIARWHLASPQPTLVQLQAGSDAYDVAQALRDSQAAALRTQVVGVAQSSVGIVITSLTAAQVRALLAVLLHKNGALTPTGTIKPLNEWAE